MNRRFQEEKLPVSFCNDVADDMRQSIAASTSFTLISMPGTGVSSLIRFITSQTDAHFIYLDINALPSITKEGFFTFLLRELDGEQIFQSYEQTITACEIALQKLTEKYNRIVIVLNHFDALKKELTIEFFNALRLLRSVNRGKIVYAFATYKMPSEFLSDEVSHRNLNQLTKIMYVKPFSEKDLRALLNILTPQIYDEKQLNTVITLSGGASILAKILVNTPSLEYPLRDQFVRLQVSNLYDNLTYPRKKTVEKIALGKQVDAVDAFLLNVGLVKKERNRYVLFTPLLEEYIKTSLPLKLSPNETKLLKILKKKLGKVVSKDELFEKMWSDNAEHATDWALNSIIYRLRKNPGFINSGYLIESHKGSGYMLIKNS